MYTSVFRDCCICDEQFYTGGNYDDSDVCCRECATNNSNNLILATPEYADSYWGRY